MTDGTASGLRGLTVEKGGRQNPLKVEVRSSWIQSFVFLVGRHRFAFLLALGWGFLNSMGGTLVDSLSLKFLFDEGIMRGNFPLFVLLGLLVVLFGTALRASELSLSLFLRRLKNRLLEGVSSHMLEVYHRLPYRELLQRGDGYFVARIYDEAKNATEPALDVASGMFQALAMVLGGLGVSFYLSWKLTAVLLLVVAGLHWASRHFGRLMRTQSKEQQESEAALKNLIVGIVRSLKETKAFQLAEVVRKAFQASFQRYATATYRWHRTAGYYGFLSGVFLSWAELAVLLGAGYSVLIGQLTFGGMMAFMSAYWYGVRGLSRLVESIPRFSQISASVERLRELERESARPRPRPALTSGEIYLNGVSFSYEDRPILQGVELKIRKGERVLVQGPNGSGKTTLALLLAGYVEPQRGEVAIPGRISAVIMPVQFPPIPLKVLLPPDKRGEARRLLERFGLLEHLDASYDSLSHGQKTKFAVALALLQEADGYLLDEPLAGVDRESAEIVMDEVFERTRGKTLVVVLHHGEAFRDRFDKVLTISPLNGRARTPRLTGKTS